MRSGVRSMVRRGLGRSVTRSMLVSEITSISSSSPYVFKVSWAVVQDAAGDYGSSSFFCRISPCTWLLCYKVAFFRVSLFLIHGCDVFTHEKLK